MRTFTLSPITQEMLPKINDVAERSFGKTARLILPKKDVWGIYAHEEGKIAGAVYLDKVADDEGVLEWIFVDPDAQGHRLGTLLFEAGQEELVKAGCTTQFSLIRETNTASWNMFAKHGYVRPRVWHTLTKYKLSSLPKRLMYGIVEGYSTWVNDPSLSLPIHPISKGITNSLLLSVIIGALLALANFIFYGTSGVDVLLILIGANVGVSLFRLVVEYPFAKAYGDIRWNALQGGAILSIGLGIVNTWWPYFGNFYPAQEYWDDRKFGPFHARAKFATWMSLAVVYVGTHFLFPETFQTLLSPYLTLLLIVQVFPGFPLDETDGARVYRHNKPLYFIGLLVTIVSVLTVVMF